MKEMTSAEFAKANLAEIEEPVRVRRYTTLMGVYYPIGFVPADLTEEVRRLKQELAARPAAAPVGQAMVGQAARMTNPRPIDEFDQKPGKRDK